MVSLLTILGGLALAGGVTGYFAFIPGLKMGIEMFVNLKEGGMVYPLYMSPPFASRSGYYIYEIRNPRDNIAFSNQEKLVRFDSHRKLSLVEEKSANLDEKFWMLNPIFLSVQKMVKDLVIDKVPFKSVSEPIVFNSVNVILDNYKERLVVKKSARDLLEGNKVELLAALTALAERFGLASLLPPGPPENIFGLSHAQNNIVDKLEIWTGVGSPEKFADVSKWKGMSSMDVWSGKCNVINGTNGELYKPFIKAGKPIKIFLSQLCRTFYLDPASDGVIPVQDGLQALEYEISQRLFMGARSNPNNKCYCKNTRTYDCQYDGLVAMGPCFFDAPIYFARPHFSGVDRRIRSLVDESTVEWEKIPTKQSFYLDPITGSVLKADLTLIGTFKIVKQPYMRDLATVQNLTYMPLFAASEYIELPPQVTWQLKYLQKMAQYHKPAMVLISIAGAGILIFGFLMRGGRSVRPPRVQPPAAITTTGQPAIQPADG